MNTHADMDRKGGCALDRECHVLLADDDETTLLVVQQLLRRSGYRGLLHQSL